MYQILRRFPSKRNPSKSKMPVWIMFLSRKNSLLRNLMHTQHALQENKLIPIRINAVRGLWDYFKQILRQKNCYLMGPLTHNTKKYTKKTSKNILIFRIAHLISFTLTVLNAFLALPLTLCLVCSLNVALSALQTQFTANKSIAIVGNNFAQLRHLLEKCIAQFFEWLDDVKDGIFICIWIKVSMF